MFFQTSVLNIQSVTIHSYVESILHFSYILYCGFGTFNHIDHVGHFAVSQSFIQYTLSVSHSSNVPTRLIGYLTALGVSPSTVKLEGQQYATKGGFLTARLKQCEMSRMGRCLLRVLLRGGRPGW